MYPCFSTIAAAATVEPAESQSAPSSINRHARQATRANRQPLTRFLSPAVLAASSRKHAADAARYPTGSAIAPVNGEGGIRTLEPGFPGYSLSRRVPSATRPPLQQTFDSMQRMAILALAALVAILVALQLALPPIIERQAEKQLTKHGGSARVHLSAFPSLRLLRKEGDSLTVRATGLVTPPKDPTSKGTLSDLDGFDRVDIQVVGMHVGPLTIARLTMQ